MACKVCFSQKFWIRISSARSVSFLLPSFNWLDWFFTPSLLVRLPLSLFLLGTFTKSYFESLWLSSIQLPHIHFYWKYSLCYTRTYTSQLRDLELPHVPRLLRRREVEHEEKYYHVLWHLSAVSVSAGILFKSDSIWVILAINSPIAFSKLLVTLFNWFTLLGKLESTG